MAKLKFRVGDKVKVVKAPIGMDSLKGMEGYVVCIPREDRQEITASFRIGVDFGVKQPGFHKLSYYNKEEQYLVPLKQSTGYWIYQSYLDFGGPPDDGDDWI